MRIILSQRTGDIHAHIEGEPGWWSCAPTAEEALAELVKTVKPRLDNIVNFEAQWDSNPFALRLPSPPVLCAVEAGGQVIVFVRDRPEACAVGSTAQQATEALINRYPALFPQPSNAQRLVWLAPVGKRQRSLLIDRRNDQFHAALEGSNAQALGATVSEVVGKLAYEVANAVQREQLIDTPSISLPNYATMGERVLQNPLCFDMNIVYTTAATAALQHDAE